MESAGRHEQGKDRFGVRAVLEDVINPGDGLLWWAWKLGKRGIRWDRARSEGQRTGSAHHRILEHLIKVGRDSMPPLDDYGPSAVAMAAAIYLWADETEPQFVAGELPVEKEYDTTVGPILVRGRIDYIRQCYGGQEIVGTQIVQSVIGPRFCDCGGAGVVVGDAKTNSVTSAKNKAQVAGYIDMLSHMRPELRICKGELLGLNLKGHGPYYVRQVDATADDFLAAVEWHARLVRLASGSR